MSEVIGAMRARVTLQSPVRTPDDLGGAALAWTNQGEMWAQISAGGATQGADYDTAPSVTAYRLVINRRDDVRAGWRTLWGERVLRIVGVSDEGAARVELYCEQETL